MTYLEKCPVCDKKLNYKMYDVDGTNLVELAKCSNCEFIHDPVINHE